MKKRRHGLQLAYVLTLNAGMPAAGILTAVLLALGYGDRLYAFLLLPILAAASAVLGIANIVQSFRVYAEKDTQFAVRSMLMMKYGLVVFFILNFILILLIFLLLFAAKRGILLFMFPAALLFCALCAAAAWLAMLPGSVWSIQTVRLAYTEEKITLAAVFLHAALSLLFLADVPDAMYLAVHHYGCGKVGAVVVSVVYAVVLIAFPVLIAAAVTVFATIQM